MNLYKGYYLIGLYQTGKIKIKSQLPWKSEKFCENY